MSSWTTGMKTMWDFGASLSPNSGVYDKVGVIFLVLV